MTSHYYLDHPLATGQDTRKSDHSCPIHASVKFLSCVVMIKALDDAP